MAEESAKLALPGEQLADEITDMGGLDLLGLDPGRREGRLGDIAEQFEHPAALALDIAGEIGLGAAQDEDFCGHVSFLPRRA